MILSKAATYSQIVDPMVRCAIVLTAVSVVPGGKGFLLPPSMRVIGAGEYITVECDGNTESALALAIRTFRHYHHIFEVIPLPLNDRAKAATMTLEFFGF
jgi:hypothetical protein